MTYYIFLESAGENLSNQIYPNLAWPNLTYLTQLNQPNLPNLAYLTLKIKK